MDLSEWGVQAGGDSGSFRRLYRRLAFGAPRLVVSFVTLTLLALVLFVVVSVR